MEERTLARRRTRPWVFLAAAIGAGLPAVALSWANTLTGGPHLYPWAGSLIFGGGIVGAAFLLAWAAEVAQLDISQALALAFVALVAVLPEYAVDIYLAWQAGADPASAYPSYATANMTGGNRLIVGFAWPLVVLLFWFKRREAVSLTQGVSLELVFLVIGALWSLSLFFKGSIALWDTAVLFPIFGVYIWLSGRAERHKPELIGPPLAIASLSVRKRRAVVVFLFLFAIVVIIFSAELFAEGLIAMGKDMGIDEFILIQWVAPLASEAPEMAVASYFALRGEPGAALTMLVSSTVNQWTLLVGSLPVAFSLAFGSPASLPLTTGQETGLLGYIIHRQQVEMLLTMAQTLFAVTLVLRLYASWRGMAVLLGMFAAQLVFSSTEHRLVFALLFLGFAMSLLLMDRQRLRGAASVLGYLRDALWGR